MSQNPYTISFGKEPRQLIPRLVQKNEVLQNFGAEYPSQQVYMITGVRGVGKTVFLTDVATALSEHEEWLIVELNPERDLLKSLAAKLSSENTLAQLFQRASINLSFFGMGLEVNGQAPITDIETALTKMLETLKKKNKRVLIEIDEVTNTKTMREFAGAFQIFMRAELPVFLLMTGLYENIYELQNEKSLTFLYRAPKIELGPLNIGAIASNYEKIFQISNKQALQMASLTNGYSFAFQTLGYLTWNNNGNFEGIKDQYKQYLEEYVYEKIWRELSALDQRVAWGIANVPSGKIQDIRKVLNMTTNQFNPYRRRLIRKGIIDGTQHGIVKFTLPLFREFVLEAACEN